MSEPSAEAIAAALARVQRLIDGCEQVMVMEGKALIWPQDVPDLRLLLALAAAHVSDVCGECGRSFVARPVCDCGRYERGC